MPQKVYSETALKLWRPRTVLLANCSFKIRHLAIKYQFVLHYDYNKLHQRHHSERNPKN
jgi:hypothetical protein